MVVDYENIVASSCTGDSTIYEVGRRPLLSDQTRWVVLASSGYRRDKEGYMDPVLKTAEKATDFVQHTRGKLLTSDRVNPFPSMHAGIVKENGMPCDFRTIDIVALPTTHRVMNHAGRYMTEHYNFDYGCDFELPVGEFLPFEPNEPGLDSQIIEQRVPGNQHIETTISPSDSRIHLIHTFGRVGCDAVLLLNIMPDKSEDIVMTHFDPGHVKEHLKLIQTYKESHGDGKRYAMLVTYDGSDLWSPALIDELTNYQGSKPDVVVLPREMIDLTRLDYLNYELCFTKGYTGNPNLHRVTVPGSNFEKQF